MAFIFRRQNKSNKQTSGPNGFALLNEARAPNVKQYLRGLRNYYVLSEHIKVRNIMHFF